MQSRIAQKRGNSCLCKQSCPWAGCEEQRAGSAGRSEGTAAPCAGMHSKGVPKWELAFSWQMRVDPYSKLQENKICTILLSPRHTFLQLHPELILLYTSCILPPLQSKKVHFTLEWHNSFKTTIDCLHPLFCSLVQRNLAISVLMMLIKCTQDKINNPSASYTEKSIGQVNISKINILLHFRG